MGRKNCPLATQVALLNVVIYYDKIPSLLVQNLRESKEENTGEFSKWSLTSALCNNYKTRAGPLNLHRSLEIIDSQAHD